MPSFEQEWISPILEVYKKRKIEDTHTVILGLNAIGQTLCRQLYERGSYETVLVFNSPSFSTWNRYPVIGKPPVVPVHGMISDELMLVFGDVLIREYEFVTDLLFYIQGNVPTRFIIALMTHEGPTCGQVLSSKGARLLKRMSIPSGRADFYDGVCAPLISLSDAADIDPVVLFLESFPDSGVIIQVDESIVNQEEVDLARSLLKKGLNLQLTE